MNSVERVHTARKPGQPDRVPVLDFVVAEKVACADGAEYFWCIDAVGAGNRIIKGSLWNFRTQP